MTRWQRETFGILRGWLEVRRRKTGSETPAPLYDGPPRNADSDRDTVPRRTFGTHPLDFQILDLGPFDPFWQIALRGYEHSENIAEVIWTD